MIYFDGAATTLQKPDSVAKAMVAAITNLASPGRGGHKASMRAAEVAYSCREAAAELFGVSDPERVVFTHNATHALNIAIKNQAQAGDRVVISGYEHNSVTRPLQAIRAKVVVAKSALFCKASAVRAFNETLTPDTKLVVLNHVSNVFGSILPIEEIAAMCRVRRIPFIIDVSQSAGVLEIRADELGADFITMPGHKGLYGPQGTGLLICKSLPDQTLIEGGTGSDTRQLAMPESLPDRLEAGTHNMPGISGLLEGIRFVKAHRTRIVEHERTLLERLAKGLHRIPDLYLYKSPETHQQTGVLSFRIAGLDCESIAEALSEQDIALRAGLHCAPLAHESAGTLETGTIRVSFSAFNTEREVDTFLSILAQMRKGLRKKE